MKIKMKKKKDEDEGNEKDEIQNLETNGQCS